MKNKYHNYPLVILGTTIISLFILSFVPENFELFGLEIKRVDILSDLKDDELDEEYQFEEYFEDDTEEDEFFIDDSTDENFDNGSLEIYRSENPKYLYAKSFLIGELVDYAYQFFNKELNKYGSTRTKQQEISGNIGHLKGFIQSLKKSKSKQIRIAHYGDSAIEGDLITADLRQILQSKFGGNGVGYVSITSQDTKFRLTTKHKFSNNWETASVYTRNPDRLPVGISGEIFVNGSNSWVEYKASQQYNTSRYFENVRIFYSDAKKGSSLNYSFDGGKKMSVKLLPSNNIKEVVLKANKKVKSIKIEFPKKETAYFYGVSLEGGSGIYVDNFPLRGNTGADLRDISLENLKAFNKLLDYDLIIFEFGLNAMNSRSGNFKRYERDMTKVVEHFAKAFPSTSFLIVGAHDRAIKKGSQLQTDPAVFKLVQAQINVAKNTKVAFWNLFEAMGGKNSIIRWVDANPPLAHKDYIHFNLQGAKKEAELLSNALLKLYK
ncbi:hypothetical protein ACFLS9_02640 [Bacteroidota bacterium]